MSIILENAFDFVNVDAYETTNELSILDSYFDNINVDELQDVNSEEIKESMKGIEQSNDEEALKVTKRKRKTGKSVTQIADDVVKKFIETKSHKDWQDLQTFFWYGIKQFAYKYMQDLDLAYDMTIETFASAWKNIESFDISKARFSTWLWTICRNNCIAYLKNKAKIPTINNDISEIYESELINSNFAEEMEPLHIQFDKGSMVTMHNDDVIKKIYNTSINEMKNIGGVTGQILEMKLVKNLKIREIADELGMNESTVKDYLYKGKHNLAKIIKINHKDLYEMYTDSFTRDYGSL